MDRGNSPVPVGIDLMQLCQSGVLHRQSPRQHLLGERRSIVGWIRLACDHNQFANEAFLLEGLSGPYTGQRASDNHDAIAHADLPSGRSVQPTLIAWTGHALAALRTCSRSAS